MEGKVKLHYNPQGAIKNRAYSNDAGHDLECLMTTEIAPNGFARVPLKGRVAIPDEYWGLLTARSSTNYAGDLLVLPGVIDAGYRGPLFAFVHNLSDHKIVVYKGSSFAQLVLIPRVNSFAVWAKALPKSERGTNGFGSTGQ